MKWNNLINNIASDIKAFVDHLRCSGYSEEEAWRVGHRVASILQYFGIQDAPRKTKPPVKETGAWAGTIFFTLDGKIEKFVSQKKWNKGQTWILHFLSELAKDPDTDLGYKEMEQATGFLCHLSMTYEELAPYLKGFYLALHYHLPWRDAEGWKTNEKQCGAYVYAKLDRGDITSDEANQMLNPPSFEDIPQPKTVKCVPELAQILPALELPFSQETPPRMLVRSASLLYIRYGFADASGTGLDASITTDEGIWVRIGT
jgi:hypothetical protein